MQDLVLEARAATWRLTQELGRTPADSDLARHLGVSGDDLRQARRAELAFQPSSLDAPLAAQPVSGACGPGAMSCGPQHEDAGACNR